MYECILCIPVDGSALSVPHQGAPQAPQVPQRTQQNNIIVPFLIHKFIEYNYHFYLKKYLKAKTLLLK